MTIVIAIISVILFILSFWVLRIIPIGKKVLSTSQQAIAILRDESYNDEEREKYMQKASLQLLKFFFFIILLGSLSIIISLAPIFIAEFLGLASSENIISFLSRIDVIIALTIIITAAYFLSKRLCHTK